MGEHLEAMMQTILTFKKNQTHNGLFLFVSCYTFFVFHLESIYLSFTLFWWNILSLQLMLHLHSSEIHEKMCCHRCEQDEIKFDYSNDGSPPEDDDIEGFASIAGCLHNLWNNQKQVSECNGIGFLGVTYALLFTKYLISRFELQRKRI